MPHIRFIEKLTKADRIVLAPIGLEKGKIKLGALLKALEQKSGGAIGRAIKSAAFSGKKGETLSLTALPRLSFARLVLVGMGEAKANEQEYRRLGGMLGAMLAHEKEAQVAVLADTLAFAEALQPLCIAALADGIRLRTYHFDAYRTRKQDKAKLKSVVVVHPDFAAVKKAYAAMEAVTTGTLVARDLVNEPPNVLTPLEFARRCAALSVPGLEVKVLDAAALAKEKMGALLAVAQGSLHAPQLVVMRYQGGSASDKPLAFIGKGVTFDTGGISLKPAASMIEFNMKCDMAGAASVTGLMLALAKRKAKVNAVGVIGLVENMISASAQRPGDVITAADGQTIEVLNTDAEGRLVLADCLHYVQTHYQPKLMVNLATLTGAVVASFAHEYAALFSNDEVLASRLAAASIESDEKLWRLPLGEVYDKMLKSDIADMKNIGGAKAGSITAAQFLQRFVRAGMSWAHLDIAGVAWLPADETLSPRNGSGFGVRLLNQFVATHYEG